MARSSRLESGFQDRLKSELKDMFPGCVVVKQDYFQGIPDLLILYGSKWAMLENKKKETAKKQPNQEYWVNTFDNMSFARFIYPENKKQVLDELKTFFDFGGKS